MRHQICPLLHQKRLLDQLCYKTAVRLTRAGIRGSGGHTAVQ